MNTSNKIEAIANQKKGMKMVPEMNVEVPILLREIFIKNSGFKKELPKIITI